MDATDHSLPLRCNRKFESGLLLASSEAPVPAADKQKERIRSLFSRQLQVPLQEGPATLEEYKDWEAGQGKVSATHGIATCELFGHLSTQTINLMIILCLGLCISFIPSKGGPGAHLQGFCKGTGGRGPKEVSQIVRCTFLFVLLSRGDTSGPTRPRLAPTVLRTPTCWRPTWPTSASSRREENLPGCSAATRGRLQPSRWARVGKDGQH